MSTFNTILRNDSTVQNHEGAEAYRLSAEMELYTAVVTASLSNKFYETASGSIERIADLVGKCDAHFVAQLAVYARTEMNLRSVPLLLVVELAKRHNGDDLISRTVEKVVLRADEIMELLICYQWRNKTNGVKKLGKLSNQIQNGLKLAFNKFDEYQFAKYNRDNLEVKLRDALFIVHPKAKDEAQQEIFNKIADNSLATPYTWETELSALGQQKFETLEEKKEAISNKWDELIHSGKLGYMALLRNLRNILQAGLSDETIDYVAKRLADKEEVLRSKQFPFRYLAAYKELRNVNSVHTSEILSALEKAVNHSASLISNLANEMKVFIACDMSGSMRTSLSANSSISNYEVGINLSMLLQSRCKKVITGIFGDNWKVINLPNDNILSNTAAIGSRIGEVGYGTYGGKPLEWLIKEKRVMDKLFFFTDCQFWDEDSFGKYFQGLWNDYKKISPNARLYLFDLQGYGFSPLAIPQDDVYCIAGWSDRIFEILSAIDKGSNVVEEIKKIQFS